MTLESTINKNRYIGNGATKEFPFTFKVWKAGQVLVFVGDGTAEQEVSAGCTIEVTASGGTVTFPTAPASGVSIAIRRRMPYIQEDDYRNGTRFDAEEVEDRLDQDCAERQDLRLDVDRAIKVPETSTKTPEEMWQDFLNKAADVAEARDMIAAWLAAVGPDAVGTATPVIANGSSVARTLGTRFSDIINVKDFGAKGDGSTDDAPAIQAAFAYAAEKSSAHVFFPYGTYYMTYGCGMPGNVFVEAGGATFVRPGIGTRSGGFFNNSYGIPLHTDGEGVSGYEGNGNIYWHGGIFQGNGQTGTSRQFQFMSFGHARNITVDGCVFYNHCGTSHAIELAGVENVVIRSCSFIGWNPIYYNVTTGEMDDASDATREAIQIECIIEAGFWIPYYDFTPARFITIDKCFFGPNPDTGLSAHSVGIGGHAGSKPNSGEIQVHDVSIVNCNFIGLKYTCARFTAWSGITFSGNKCYNCKRMVAFSGRFADSVSAESGEAQSTGLACSNILVSCNQFFDEIGVHEDSWVAISTTNSLSTETIPAYHENITISNNLFLRPETSLPVRDYCIKLDGCRQITISGNLFRYHTNNVIEIVGISTGVHIIDNDIRHFDSYGISIWGSSGITNVYVENNNIIGDWVSGNYMAQGIRVQNVTDFRIVNNNVDTLITKSGGTQVSAILVDAGSQDGFVDGNTVKTRNTDESVYDIAVTSSNGGVVNGKNVIRTTTGGGSFRSNTGAFSSPVVSGSFNLLRETYAPAGIIFRNVSTSTAPAVAGSWTSSGGGLLTFGLANPDVSQNSFVTLLALSDAADGNVPSLRPVTDGVVRLGTAGAPYDAVYANSGNISMSDGRYKRNIVDAEQDALMRAWGKVNFKVFQFADSVEKKGTEARLHVGVVAQDVAEAFESEGLDAGRYGLFCYDEWEDQYEDVEVVDADAVFDSEGVEISPAVTHVEHVKVQEAGDKYSIRYEEALALECAYQRWRLEQMEERLAALEVQ